MIHIWPYQDIAERNRIRAEAVKDGTWPPKTSNSSPPSARDLHSVPDVADTKPGKLGSHYEMRIYTLEPGGLPKIAMAWRKHCPSGSLCLLARLGGLEMSCTSGPIRRWMRGASIRSKAQAAGVWPPSAQSRHAALQPGRAGE